MPKNLNNIVQIMKKHYQSSFRQNGPNSAGVDWGDNPEKALLRYKIMLAVILAKSRNKPTFIFSLLLK